MFHASVVLFLYFQVFEIFLRKDSFPVFIFHKSIYKFGYLLDHYNQVVVSLIRSFIIYYW